MPACGHKSLIAFLLQGTKRARVCLEANGNYSLQLALALHAHWQVEVRVINPRRARRFAESLASEVKPIPLIAAYFANTPRACLGRLGSRLVRPPCVCAPSRVRLRAWALCTRRRTIGPMPWAAVKLCQHWY